MSTGTGPQDDMPRISVLVSNHNYGWFVEEAVASVRAQTLPAHEIIIVDDGSTDDSREFLARLGDDVRVILQEQRGQAGAMDTAVAASTGDVLCFLDADDVFLPEKLARVAAVFRDFGDVEWVRHPQAMTDRRLERLGPVVPAIRRAGRVRPHRGVFAERVITAATSGIAVRRTLAERVFPLSSATNARAVFDLRRDADALLLSRCAAAGATGYTMTEVLSMYRQHEHQMYTGPSDVRTALERQIELADALAAELYAAPVRPSQSHKHAMILATLDGSSRWSARRARAWLEGALVAGRMLHDRPVIAGRQIGALTLAFLAPNAWLKRFHRSHAWSA